MPTPSPQSPYAPLWLPSPTAPTLTTQVDLAAGRPCRSDLALCQQSVGGALHPPPAWRRGTEQPLLGPLPSHWGAPKKPQRISLSLLSGPRTLSSGPGDCSQPDCPRFQVSIPSHPYSQGQRGCWQDGAIRNVLLVLLAMNLCTLHHSAPLSLLPRPHRQMYS